jgi:hypothetical protein
MLGLGSTSASPALSIGERHADPSLWSHATPHKPSGACGLKASGTGIPSGEVNADFSSANRAERGARPRRRESSRPAVSRLGIVPSRARPLRNFSGVILPLINPVEAQNTPAALHAVTAASGPRSSGQHRQGGKSFFPESLFLSLAAPPAAPPLRGQETFGSSLKGTRLNPFPLLPLAPSRRFRPMTSAAALPRSSPSTPGRECRRATPLFPPSRSLPCLARRVGSL